MMGELTRYQFEEQLLNVHVESVEVRVKSMACLRNHDAAQRATIQHLEARIVQLETDVDMMAWKTSPAMAQATIDQLVKRNEQLEARVKEFEGRIPTKEYWVKDKHLIEHRGKDTERMILDDRAIGLHHRESYWKVVKCSDLDSSPDSA